jgi:hypothetical protein
VLPPLVRAAQIIKPEFLYKLRVAGNEDCGPPRNAPHFLQSTSKVCPLMDRADGHCCVEVLVGKRQSFRGRIDGRCEMRRPLRASPNAALILSTMRGSGGR